VGERMLKYLGYHVTSFSSPVAALQAFRAAPDDFDLVITDLTMPGLLGTELATELLQVRPSLPIVLCSGYSSLSSREKILEAGIRAFLSKPLSIHQLAIEVRKVLSGGEQA
ncbi:MAG: response regulator, partial [Desulfobulbaceae bacterium]|nr:response regulator [Desulfobulbaceae bacterium]